MDREQLKQKIKEQIPCTDYLEKSKANKYCCPFCGSGKKEGGNGTGAVKYYPDTNTWACHSCGKGGDVIALAMQAERKDYNETFSLLAARLGIAIDRPTAAAHSAAHTNPAQPKATAQNAGGTPDYSSYYADCRKRINDPAFVAYMQSRGISLETVEKLGIGFDPAADPVGAPGAMGNAYKPHPCPRAIFPSSKAHYMGRRIDGMQDYAKMNVKGSKPAIFNSGALYAQDVQIAFVTEGAVDAASFVEIGYPAIALNSAGNAKVLLEQLEQRKTTATLILCPDSDSNPQTAARVTKEFDELATGLQKLGIDSVTVDINGAYKDANEHLINDRIGFSEAVQRAQLQAAAAKKPDNTSYYISTLMADDIARFGNPKPTGFVNLDAATNGGIYPGLICIAAVSSLGKTTFCAQLMDQLAAAGKDVLFFSLEQSRLELVSKSIARSTVSRTAAGWLNFSNAITSLAIRRGCNPQRLEQAVKEYKAAVGDRVSIIEGNFACDTTFIGEYTRRYIKSTGKRPLLIIDYLQITQPPKEFRRQSAKEQVDATVTALKRLSRELDITIIAISSVNRANYLAPIDFESLKESGGIEYSCDVLWGLQLQVLTSLSFEKAKEITEKRELVKQAKMADPRKIELSCLKNRNGGLFSVFFDYYPAFDIFRESDPEETDVTSGVGRIRV